MYLETMVLAFKNNENKVSLFAFFINDLISSIDENSYGICRYSSKEGGHNILEFSKIDNCNLIPSSIVLFSLTLSISKNNGLLSIKTDSSKSPFLF